jgi:hypothetical protein
MAIREIKGQGVGIEVRAGVDGWTAFNNGDVYAVLGEMGG